MKYLLYFILLGEILFSQNYYVSTVKELESIFKNEVDSVTVYLDPGIYELTPKNIVDSSCGNCQNPDILINVTAGLIITGNYIKLIGNGNFESIISTNSGYGLYILNSASVEISNLVITNGERDASSMATDAAIVVKNSATVIKGNIIRDNIGDSATVVKNIVGIMGICGRENSKLVIEENQILRNSWDGITLYRDAEAVIKNNIVDGIDKATSKIAGGGRGVAIGITWNAQATVLGNLMKRYWKGLGVFVDAHVEANYNIIEDMITWGIAYWDAGFGRPVGFFENNIIYNTGACGVSISREIDGKITGEFKNNVIVKTGQNEKYDSPDYYCAQCALAIYAKPNSFEITDNLFYGNRRATEGLPDYDLSNVEFIRLYNDWINGLNNNYYQQSDIQKFIRDLENNN